MARTSADDQVADLVRQVCRRVLQHKEFLPGLRSGWLTPGDTSEVYGKTHRRIGNNPGIQSLTRYTVYVANEEAVRYYRRELAAGRKYREHHFPLDGIREPTHEEDDPILSDRLTRSELIAKLNREIGRLPSAEAAVVWAWMRSSYGDSAIESAARELGMSRTAAYKLFQSAKKRLRERFPELERT